MCVCACFAVEAEEIARLGKRFKKLDIDGSGSLTIDEFMKIPELQQNPVVKRVVEIFDADGNGEIDFRGKLALINFQTWHRVVAAHFFSFLL